MITAVAVLLGCAAVVGAGASAATSRRFLCWALATLTVALVCAGAVVALAAPPAQGVGLAVVRVAAVAAAMAGGSALVTLTFRLAGADTAASTSTSTSTEQVAEDGPVSSSNEAEPLRGGRAIGVLERAAIAACILANFSAGLAVIVAAKGLARYPELRNPGAAEQFIIGTFVSVLWAAGCAGVAVAIGN